MQNKDLRWIEEASDSERDFRRMVVGWQMILRSLNTVTRDFNDEYLRAPEDKDDSQQMREIAVKKFVIASLVEVKVQLDRWYNDLLARDALSNASVKRKEAINREVHQVEKHSRMRNNAFHFSDPNTNTDVLLKLYREVDSTSLELLKRIHKGLASLGETLKRDALVRCGEEFQCLGEMPQPDGS